VPRRRERPQFQAGLLGQRVRQGEAEVEAKRGNYGNITFKPDLARFQMTIGGIAGSMASRAPQREEEPGQGRPVLPRQADRRLFLSIVNVLRMP
jgi:hypothetical protein